MEYETIGYSVRGNAIKVPKKPETMQPAKVTPPLADQYMAAWGRDVTTYRDRIAELEARVKQLEADAARHCRCARGHR